MQSLRGLFVLIFLAEVTHAFVNKPPTSFSVATMLPKCSESPNYHRGLTENLPITNAHAAKKRCSFLMMAMEKGGEEAGEESKLPFWLDPGTRGGAVVLSVILFVLPLLIYSAATNVFGLDGVEAGKWIGVGFTAIATVLWVVTYIFRVATKDMTYAKQLKDYENAVIAKRLEELDDDEIQALVEEIERDEF